MSFCLSEATFPMAKATIRAVLSKFPHLLPFVEVVEAAAGGPFVDLLSSADPQTIKDGLLDECAEKGITIPKIQLRAIIKLLTKANEETTITKTTKDIKIKKEKDMSAFS